MTVAMNATGAPGWLAGLDHHLAALIPGYGISLVIDLAMLQAITGAGVLMARRARLAAVVLGIGLALLYWVAGRPGVPSRTVFHGWIDLMSAISRLRTASAGHDVNP